MEDRLSLRVIKRLSALGLEHEEIDDVVISSRTLQHHRTHHEKLTVEESDRVLRLIRVIFAAESVYGSRQRAFSLAQETA